MNDDTLIDGMVLDRLYLHRLRRLARLARAPDVAAVPRVQRLAGRATVAAYRGCVARGLERQAREILTRARGGEP